ncbi:MAG: nucleotide exchange factor GrpE [Ruminococcaceae bacterium]|nr:nucleotide exchange factor GrpE [Oscillospiraceae bacterium]
MATEENKNTVAEETLDEVTEAAEEIVEEVPEKTAEEALKEEVDSLKDKLMRHAAEFDNFKKRNQKEREELYSTAVCDTVEKILPVKDNLERAVQAADAEEGGDCLKEGVKMILKQLDDVLAAMGVEKIKTVGEEFNPELHNAVMHEENEEFGENTVSEELMSGYLCKGKVVRFAMVKVAN